MKKATCSEVRTSKRELILNFSFKDIYQPPTKAHLLTQWQLILASIDDILNKDTHTLCYQAIYSELNSLLLFNIPEEVIASLNSILLAFAKKTSAECNTLINTADFFSSFNPIWKNVVSRFNLIKKLLNRFEKKAYDNIQKNTIYLICKLYPLIAFIVIDYFKQSTSEGGIENFFDCLIANINESIIQLRKCIISKAIEYNDPNIALFMDKLKLGVDLLCECGKYKDGFNAQFIASSYAFYETMSACVIQSSPLDVYVAFVQMVVEFENKLVLHHLNEISLKPLISQLNTILLQEKSKEIFDLFYAKDKGSSTSGDGILIEKYDLMKSIYMLFKGIKYEEDVKKRFSDYISQCSNKIYEVYSKNFIDFFANLLKFKNNIDSIIRLSFLNDEKLKTIGKDSLAKTTNLKPNFIADSFSRYIDYVITSQISTEEAKKAIDDFMILFKLLDAKDSFENFFINKLAFRCLYSLEHREWELYLIEQFKKECGSVFVTKSEEMLNDIETSQSLSGQYAQNSLEKPNVYSYYVLSTYSWPVSTIITGYVSEGISQKEKHFASFYIGKNQGKALTWHLPYYNCLLEFKGGDSTAYSVKANGVHASILLKYSKGAQVHKTSELAKKTKIGRNELLPALKAIASTGILIHNRESDSFAFNSGFKSEKTVICLMSLGKEETSVDEMEIVEERTLEDRKPVIDAYIIKLLKPKKQMKLDELVIAVSNSIKFACEKQVILLRINHLINNRYIVKDEIDDQLIKYT